MSILALTDPNFHPAMRIISGITNTNPVVITTSFDHDYQTGLIVRIKISRGSGMQQINMMKGPITVLSPTTFSMPINAELFDVFVFPVDVTRSALSVPATTPQKQYTPSQVVPVGQINSSLTLATRNVL